MQPVMQISQPDKTFATKKGVKIKNKTNKQQKKYEFKLQFSAVKCEAAQSQ